MKKLSVLLLCTTLIFSGALACGPGEAEQPAPKPTMGEATVAPQAAEATLTPTPSLVTLPSGSQVPLPGDAEMVPVVEGFYIGFATSLVEPQLFDFYAAWLSQRGWVLVAPTEAAVSQPHQRWRKDDQELLIELQSPDEQGRTVAWLQVSSLPPQPTAMEVAATPTGKPLVGLALPTALPPQPTIVESEPTRLVGITSSPTPVPTVSPLPPLTIITPENARQLTEVSQAQIGLQPGELAWSPNSRWLAVSEAGQLRLYEAGTLTLVSLPHEIEAGVLAFSPDSAYLATTRYEESGQLLVEVWQVADWTLALTLEGHPRAIMDLAFSPDGSLLASAAVDARVRLWRTTNGELVHEIKVSYMGVHPPGVFSVAFSPDGTQVVAGVYGGSVQGWQVDDGTQIANFQAASLPQPNDVLFLPSGLLVTIEDYGADLWQLDGTHLAEFKGDSSPSHGAVSPDGRVLAVVHRDGVELWDTANHTLVHRMDASGTQKVAFSPDGVYLATAGDDKILRLWGVR